MSLTRLPKMIVRDAFFALNLSSSKEGKKNIQSEKNKIDAAFGNHVELTKKGVGSLFHSQKIDLNKVANFASSYFVNPTDDDASEKLLRDIFIMNLAISDSKSIELVFKTLLTSNEPEVSDYREDIIVNLFMAIKCNKKITHWEEQGLVKALCLALEVTQEQIDSKTSAQSIIGEALKKLSKYDDIISKVSKKPSTTPSHNGDNTPIIPEASTTGVSTRMLTVAALNEPSQIQDSIIKVYSNPKDKIENAKAVFGGKAPQTNDLLAVITHLLADKDPKTQSESKKTATRIIIDIFSNEAFIGARDHMLWIIPAEWKLDAELIKKEYIGTNSYDSINKMQQYLTEIKDSKHSATAKMLLKQIKLAKSQSATNAPTDKPLQVLPTRPDYETMMITKESITEAFCSKNEQEIQKIDTIIKLLFSDNSNPELQADFIEIMFFEPSISVSTLSDVFIGTFYERGNLRSTVSECISSLGDEYDPKAANMILEKIIKICGFESELSDVYFDNKDVFDGYINTLIQKINQNVNATNSMKNYAIKIYKYTEGLKELDKAFNAQNAAGSTFRGFKDSSRPDEYKKHMRNNFKIYKLLIKPTIFG